jgi:D-arginine dehydrogenase
MNASDIQTFDVVVIGAGIAGATAAAHLALDHKVALVEAEESAGYHSTGRSAAIWILNYGPPSVVAMTGASRQFFENPPPGFADVSLMSRRGTMFLAPDEQLTALEALLAQGSGLRELTVAQAREMVPAIRPDYAKAAAIEPDSFDMDVAALHQGFLRQLRGRGGVLALRSRAGRIEHTGGMWQVDVSGGAAFRAPVVVNAAGAWGDVVAKVAGVAPLGLQPCRRTGVIIDPAPWHATDWPMINDVAHTWYTRPEARTKLMVSPADETPMDPQDIQPDELDIAIAVDRMQQALDIEVRRVEHSWAGLRSFLPDRNFAVGWDKAATGFFWSIGQGGYGIQTSPAAGRLVADLVAGRDPGELARILPTIDPGRFAPAPA